MHAIGQAIDWNKYLKDRIPLQNISWEMYKEISRNKKNFLFGVGQGLDLLVERYKEFIFEGVVDNDSHKWGLSLEQFRYDFRDSEFGKKVVTDPISLKSYDKNNVTVLILSLNGSSEIRKQLNEMGVTNIFLAEDLELNQRAVSIRKKSELERLPEERYEYFSLKCMTDAIQPKKVVCYSLLGRYADHEKYIISKLQEICDDLDVVWIINDLKTVVPQGIRLIYDKDWKACIYEMQTAKVWLFDALVPHYVKKREGQIYIQTKHWSSITLKKFYLDADDNPSSVEYIRQNTEKMDYIIVGSSFDEVSCRSGYGFNGKVLNFGSPRSDAMFQKENNLKKIQKSFTIAEGVRLLLYAPTYRYDVSGQGKHSTSKNIGLEFEMLRYELIKKFGGEWMILLRLHQLVAKESKKMCLPPFVIDVSDYQDSQELASAADIMITDYSSIMFEPAFVHKPVFLFATDKGNYIGKEYDLLIDYDTLPFPIAENNNELCKIVRNFDQQEYDKKLNTFFEKYDVHEDGHASDRAARFISGLLKD